MNKTQTAQVLHFLELKLQNFSGDAIEPLHFLMRQSQAFDQLYVAQGFRRGTGERRGFRHNVFLDFFDTPTQCRADETQQRDGDSKSWDDYPMHPEGVNHYKNHAHQRRKHNVNGSRNEALYIASYLLQFA